MNTTIDDAFDERNEVFARYTGWLNRWAKNASGGPNDVAHAPDAREGEYRWKIYDGPERLTVVLIFRPHRREIVLRGSKPEAEQREYLYGLFKIRLQEAGIIIGPFE
jgi:hypothetical protein